MAQLTKDEPAKVVRLFRRGAETEVSKAGQTSLNLNSGGGVEQIAGQILQSQINIPPTIYVPPGAIVSLLIDHPIDFSDAIKATTR